MLCEMVLKTQNCFTGSSHGLKDVEFLSQNNFRGTFTVDGNEYKSVYERTMCKANANQWLLKVCLFLHKPNINKEKMIVPSGAPLQIVLS